MLAGILLLLTVTQSQAKEVELDDLCYTSQGKLGYAVRFDDPFKETYCSAVGGETGCGSDGGICQMDNGKIGTCVRTGEWWNERSYCSQLWQDKD